MFILILIKLHHVEQLPHHTVDKGW